ncbi:hypothetical protein EF888_07155 [Silicimonas algicola]|nr:DUF6884 domain-containing protein [Silicimonas algicola]AZQ66936.1 hypothetical protein EF888_07155 [Silicimonas algicola]
MERVFLVSCVAGKRPEPTPAAELYTSSWFVKARRLVESSREPWFILSAEHGLLSPDRIIAPYERTLNAMSSAERQEWSRRVQRQMDEKLPEADEVVVLAGSRYRANLMPYLRERFRNVVVPMEGLKIGQQLRWLKNATSV